MIDCSSTPRLRSLSLTAAGAATLTLLCIGVLASYMASVLVYKIWYVATALAGAIALLTAMTTAIRVDGLGRALVPVLVYFAYLAATALWAVDPGVVLTWVAIDSIEIAVVALFYLWALNSSARQLCWAAVALAYLCIPIAVVLQTIDPDAQRFGYRALSVVPMLVPFCWYLWQRERSVPALVGLAAVIGLLLISRSRTPLAAALIALLLSMWATSTNRREFLRRAVLTPCAVLALALLLFAVPVTRPFLAGTFSRLTYQDVDLGDVLIEAEAVDEVRWNVFFSALELWWKQQPLGMGYMSFMVWFEDHFGISMPLHNSLQTWAVEGGLPCLVIVGWMFLRYFRLLRLSRKGGHDDDAMLAGALRWAMVATLISGLFHQAHQTPMMFGLLGMGYAFARRYRNPGFVMARSALFARSWPRWQPRRSSETGVAT